VLRQTRQEKRPPGLIHLALPPPYISYAFNLVNISKKNTKCPRIWTVSVHVCSEQVDATHFMCVIANEFQ